MPNLEPVAASALYCFIGLMLIGKSYKYSKDANLTTGVIIAAGISGLGVLYGILLVFAGM